MILRFSFHCLIAALTREHRRRRRVLAPRGSEKRSRVQCLVLAQGDRTRCLTKSAPRISREHVGKLACLRAQSTAAAGCEARSAEQPADGNPRRLSRTRSVLDNAANQPRVFCVG